MLLPPAWNLREGPFERNWICQTLQDFSCPVCTAHDCFQQFMPTAKFPTADLVNKSSPVKSSMCERIWAEPIDSQLHHIHPHATSLQPTKPERGGGACWQRVRWVHTAREFEHKIASVCSPGHMLAVQFDFWKGSGQRLARLARCQPGPLSCGSCAATMLRPQMFPTTRRFVSHFWVAP